MMTRQIILSSLIAWLTTLPAFADWPNTGNEKLDSVLSEAKGASHQKAYPLYQKALLIDPKCADIYTERASHYERDGQYSKALQDCEKALQLRPDNAFAYLTKARTCLQAGKYDEAISAADKASASAGRNQELDNDELRVWGAALYHLGKYKEALVPLTSGMNYVPTKRKSADALYYRALCYEKLKNNSNALIDLDSAIKSAPKRAQYYVARARILRSTGDVKGAAKDEKLARELPKETHVLFY
ncbi:MAG: tetratricopeptide repeat protein [Candidatus Obscuribacterales bacterium]|jgi:tetratricopeptide (TPR) repeat protein|nr:tetratricopeptide repeat protein [Candidatus Obscuribacterales bacterium]